MTSERFIVKKLFESRSIGENFTINNVYYWRRNGCWKCPAEYKDNPTERLKRRQSVDDKEYNKLYRFSRQDGAPKFNPATIEEVPRYNELTNIPKVCDSDFRLFKSHIDRITNNIGNYGDEYTRSETRSAFEYISALMCKHSCTYETLRKRYQNKNYIYHRMFSSIDSTIKHELANSK